MNKPKKLIIAALYSLMILLSLIVGFIFLAGAVQHLTKKCSNEFSQPLLLIEFKDLNICGKIYYLLSRIGFWEYLVLLMFF